MTRLTGLKGAETTRMRTLMLCHGGGRVVVNEGVIGMKSEGGGEKRKG